MEAKKTTTLRVLPDKVSEERGVRYNSGETFEAVNPTDHTETAQLASLPYPPHPVPAKTEEAEVAKPKNQKTTTKVEE